PLVLHAELVADPGQKLPELEQRIEDQRDVDVLRESAEEQTTHRRLAGADLAGELHDAAVLLDAEEQVRQRFLVARAHVEEAGVGGVRERPLPKAEVGDVHRRGCATQRRSSGWLQPVMRLTSATAGSVHALPRYP